jgi:predicted aldo/keto reductase-like oxidoreductase
MHYRKFGKTGESVSTLGFGCMRLPIIDGDTKKIDEELASQMVRKAIDEGVNYIDTAWPYHGQMSEPFVAKVLKDGYRDKVKLATKLPSWLIKETKDFDYYLDQQLIRLEVEYIDFYLIHALDQERFDNMVALGLFDFIKGAKADGRIKYIGFSFHDEAPVFKEIINAFDWDFCQIQLNYIDTNHQQGIEGMYMAAQKGMGIVIMEPLRGGKIVKVPDEVQNLFDHGLVKRSPVEWAMRWLLDHEELHVILSGMSEMYQVSDNLRIFNETEAHCMSEDEHELMSKAKDAFNKRIKVDCTACNYCMPCPAGVLIPNNFALYNEYHLFDHDGHRQNIKNQYQEFEVTQMASACVECGQCEAVCPQHIQIIEELKKVTKTFA